MKKVLCLIVAFLIIGGLCACDGKNNEIEKALNHESPTINVSPDKYTHYIRDYVGKNLASFGKGDDERYDEYGYGEIYFTLASTDGKSLSLEDLEDYIVISQSVAPNTELKYQYQKDDDGKEYDTLIASQNIEKIELRVAKIATETTEKKEKVVSEKAQKAIDHTPVAINVSPDKYTFYMKDYVGKTIDQCGTLRLGGFLMDSYGKGGIKLVILTDDGVSIDVEDKLQLKSYIVTSQGCPPNSEIKYTFSKKDDGTEYDNLISYQNIEDIELYVTKIYQ